MGRTASAVKLAGEGVALYNRMGLTLRLANGRYALGLALARANRPEEAHVRLTEALAVFRESRQRLWEGMTLFRLAEVQLTAERPAQAAALAEQALTMLLHIGGEWRRANVLTVLGRALHGIGQADRAQVCWREALSVFEQLEGSRERGRLPSALHDGSPQRKLSRVHRSFIAAVQSCLCRNVASGGRRFGSGTEH